MSERLPSTSLFEDAIDVPLWLEADHVTPFADRLHRDRAIARRLAAKAPVERVRRWWRDVRLPSGADTGRNLARWRGLISAAMLILGVFTGSGVALAAFHYDGTMPINVVTALALLVLAPLALLLPSLLLMVGRRRGLRAIADVFASLSVGALAGAVYRRLAQAPADLTGLFGWQAGRSDAVRRFAQWQLAYWSQLAAVAFNVASIATATALVTFTDLAFGWSTTLSLAASDVTTLVHALALPWRELLPAAVPDATLIEQSQFFRLAGTRPSGIEASHTLTGWWSFVVMAIVCYGLTPRLLLLLLTGQRLAAATRNLLLDDARVTALLHRMDRPVLSTAALEPERIDPTGDVPSPTHPPAPRGVAPAVIWGGSLPANAAASYALQRFGYHVTATVEAGGDRTLAADHETLAALAAAAPDTVLVFTRAWEPPLLELFDYLNALRERLGAAVSIIVAPVAEDRAVVPANEQATWTRAIARRGDPHLYVETGAAA